MGRRPRIHYPGAVYHAMARGVDGRNIFLDEQDRLEFLRSLRRIQHETSAVIYAYCLMSNHFHIALKVAAVPLSAIVQRILTGYSLSFNHKHGRTGHLFQARYKSTLCLTDLYLLRLIRYIQMNPVRAGLVEAAEDWPWSSRTPMELPNLDAGVFDPWPKSELSPTIHRAVFRQAYTLNEISTRISIETGVGVDALRSNSKFRPIVRARIRLAQEAVRYGHRLNEIAVCLGTRTEVISYYLRKNSTNLQA